VMQLGLQFGAELSESSPLHAKDGDFLYVCIERD
jgi:hypothetical protein